MRWRMGHGRFMEDHLRMLSKSRGAEPRKHPHTFPLQSAECPADYLRTNGDFLPPDEFPDQMGARLNS